MIQKRTRADSMRQRGRQKIAMNITYILCFHIEHRQIVCAAHTATASADKTLFVDLRELIRPDINLTIERVQQLQ